MTPVRRCLNCDSELLEPARFCARCAQRTDTARLSIHDVVRDLMQTFVDIERGPLAFAWALSTGPGLVAREYVEGKRRRHYGPFATLMVLVGLTALAVNLSGYQILSHDGLASGPTVLLQKHFNLLLLAQLPLLGAASAVLFHRAHLSLAEHLVLAAYVLSVRAVFLALVAPITYATSSSPGVGWVYAYWAAWYVYYGWAASQFYRGPRVRSWLLGIVTAAAAHGAIVVVLTLGSAAFGALTTSR